MMHVLTCVHEVAEELPASGDLKEGEALLLGYSVQGSTCGHASRHTLGSQPSPVNIRTTTELALQSFIPPEVNLAQPTHK